MDSPTLTYPKRVPSSMEHGFLSVAATTLFQVTWLHAVVYLNNLVSPSSLIYLVAVLTLITPDSISFGNTG